MALFRRTPPSREKLVAWTTNQMRLRVTSLEAHEVSAELERLGLSPEEIVWTFLTKQWEIVLAEAEQKYRGSREQLWTDAGAMAACVPVIAEAQFPLSHDRATVAVLERLRQVATEQGWKYSSSGQ